MGFGVPVVIRNFQTYLSFTATLETVRAEGREGLRKTFFLNALERFSFKGIEVDNTLAYTGVELSGSLYKRIKWLQGFLPKSNYLRKKAGFELFFKEVKPLAKITVDYRLSSDNIEVSVDLSDFNKMRRKDKVFILNEAGARFFPFYQDIKGRALKRKEIGAWSKVEAGQACFFTEDKSTGFCVQQQQVAGLYRGWELCSDSLSWAGFIYDLSRFKEPVFTYSVTIV